MGAEASKGDWHFVDQSDQQGQQDHHFLMYYKPPLYNMETFRFRYGGLHGHLLNMIFPPSSYPVINI